MVLTRIQIIEGAAIFVGNSKVLRGTEGAIPISTNLRIEIIF